MFRFTVRNMLGNATSQDVMNFRTVIEGRNNNHVDQSRDFKVLQTPQPVPAKSQKRWNIGKINTYIIYTAYTSRCVCAHLVNIGMEQKTELGSMQNFTLLKTTIWWFSEVFFFFATDTTSANIYALWDGRSRSWNSFTLLFPFNASCHFMFFKRARKICHLSRTIVSLESLGMSYIWKLCHQQFLVGICKESVF